MDPSAMRILVFQHLRVEHPGIFLEFWARAGHEVVQVELDEGEAIPDLEAYDLLAVMGGPMDVWQEDIHPWLVVEKAVIRRWVRDMGRPYIGICLGHQLLASALGGTVGPMISPEVGLVEVHPTLAGQDDPVMAGLGAPLKTFQWHGAEVKTLPNGATVIAANPACATQAIRYGRHAYGFQFHVEMTERTVADWIEIPEYAASLDAALGPIAATHLAETVAPHLVAFRETAARLNHGLLAAIELSAAIEPVAPNEADGR